MTYVTILGVTEISCNFRLVLEGKLGKEIPVSPKIRVLINVFSKQLTLSNVEVNTSRTLNRRGIAV